MKASFRFTSPNMLAEAQMGELFVSLGPDLVECVCALRCVRGSSGIEPVMPDAARFNPDAQLPVVVVACRVGADEPEFHPAGFTTSLSGATPIQFLQQCEAVQLQPRIEPQKEGLSDEVIEAYRTVMNGTCEAMHFLGETPLYANLDAMQRDMDQLHVIGRRRIDALRQLREHNRAHGVPAYREPAEFLGRQELASRL